MSQIIYQFSEVWAFPQYGASNKCERNVYISWLKCEFVLILLLSSHLVNSETLENFSLIWVFVCLRSLSSHNVFFSRIMCSTNYNFIFNFNFQLGTWRSQALMFHHCFNLTFNSRKVVVYFTVVREFLQQQQKMPITIIWNPSLLLIRF